MYGRIYDVKSTVLMKLLLSLVVDRPIRIQSLWPANTGIPYLNIPQNPFPAGHRLHFARRLVATCDTPLE
jgi:hypothetical protein